MAKKILSKTIGYLSQHHQDMDWWISKNIAIPYFNEEKMRFIFVGYDPKTDNSFSEEVEYILENFLSLTSHDRLIHSEFIYKSFFKHINNFKGYSIADNKDILSFIEPMNIYIKRKKTDNYKIFIFITFECEWINDCDLLLVFQEGKTPMDMSRYELELKHP